MKELGRSSRPRLSAISSHRPTVVSKGGGDEGGGDDVDGPHSDARDEERDSSEEGGAFGDRREDAGSPEAKHGQEVRRRSLSTESWQRIGEILIILLYYAVGVAFYTNTEGKACENKACEKRCDRISHLSTQRPPGMCEQHWTIIDAIYFITVSVSTVGYGDFVPHETRSKIFSFVYLMVAMPWMFLLLSRLIKNLAQLASSALLRFSGVPCAARGNLCRRQLKSVFLEQLFFLVAMFVVNVIFAVLFMILQPEWVPAYDEVYREFANCTAYPEYADHCSGDYDPKLWVMGHAVWHCVITALTIGYTVGPSEIGAFIGPRAQAARLLSCLHVLVCVTMLNIWWSRMFAIYDRRRTKAVVEEATKDSTRKLGGDVSAERYEFVVGLLVKMGKTSVEEVTDLEARFAALDVKKRRTSLAILKWRPSGFFHDSFVNGFPGSINGDVAPTMGPRPSAAGLNADVEYDLEAHPDSRMDEGLGAGLTRSPNADKTKASA